MINLENKNKSYIIFLLNNRELTLYGDIQA